MPLCEVPSSRFKVKSLSPQLNSLEFLLFYVKTDAVYHQDVTLLHIWLSQCTGLKELWVRNGKTYNDLLEKLIWQALVNIIMNLQVP
jgi:hypothetical protein